MLRSLGQVPALKRRVEKDEGPRVKANRRFDVGVKYGKTVR